MIYSSTTEKKTKTSTIFSFSFSLHFCNSFPFHFIFFLVFFQSVFQPILDLCTSYAHFNSAAIFFFITLQIFLLLTSLHTFHFSETFIFFLDTFSFFSFVFYLQLSFHLRFCIFPELSSIYFVIRNFLHVSDNRFRLDGTSVIFQAIPSLDY